MSLISELKRRRVFKVAAAYVVVAWVVIQVAATVAPQLGLPEWVPRLITLVVLLGFPVALVLSWVFDVTPEGIRADASSSGSRRVYAVALVLVALVVGWYVRTRPSRADDASARRSIAVLPFVNMSGDPKRDYFSDGISEEILNVLARTPDLEVAARTSSFAFKGQAKEVPEIARDLNVRMVLEGSVRQQGDRVRITAQLIDAATGYHLWSQTYDRELTDIFAIQDDIARAIGKELQIQVSGRAASTSDANAVTPEAHDLYLRGLTLWRSRSAQGLWDAIDLFEKAAAEAPEFAPAYAGLALVYAVLPDYSRQISHEEAFRRGRDAAERAIALDATLPEPFAALGQMVFIDGNRETGLALMRRATVLNPSFATAHQWLGTSLASGGDLEQGLASLKRASELDPRSAIVANNYGFMLLGAGRDSDAVAVCAPVLDASPDEPLCLEVDALARLLEGDFEGARPSLERWARGVGSSTEREAADLLAALEGRTGRHAFARWLAKLPLQGPWVGGPDENFFAALDIPAVLMVLDEPDLTLDFLERAAADPHSSVAWAMPLPVLDPIRCDPRFQAAARKAGFADRRAPSQCAVRRDSSVSAESARGSG